MGGEFTGRRPEHNFRSDVTAAHKVLTSGIPSLYVGLDVTTTVWFDEADLASVTSSGSALATLVEFKCGCGGLTRTRPGPTPTTH